jgi:hypothetical protein
VTELVTSLRYDKSHW